MPWDLSQWVDKSLLLAWVREEVGRLDWANPRLREHLEANPKFRPRLMLCLLTWAYVTGLFESLEIAEASARDSRWEDLTEGQPPSVNAVTRFRRENRGLIRWCLLQVLKKATRVHCNLKESRLPAGLRRHLEEAAALRIDIARQMDRGSSGF